MERPPLRIVGIALAASLAAGAAWWGFTKPRPATELALQGNVEVRQVNLGFKVAGRVKSMLVDEGDGVREGQKLAELDPVYFQDTIGQLKAQRDQLEANLTKLTNGNRPEEIAQAEATVAERDAALTNAKITLDRAEALFNASTGTRKAYDDALAVHRQVTAQLNSARQALTLMKAGARKEDIAAARAQLANGDAALKIAERQLVDASLVAPNDGVVLTRVREAGAIVNAGETVFVLSLTSPVWIRTYVSEIDLGRVKPGQIVTVKIDTSGIPPMKGRIGFISTTAEFTPKTVETRELRTALVYRVRVVVEDPSGVLRQGMPVTLAVATDDRGTAADAKVSEKRP